MNTELLIRPVKCHFCNGQMFYSDEERHEPEVSVSIHGPERFNEPPEFHFYAHVRCWNQRMDGKKEPMNDPLKPSVSLLIKLGSIIVYQEEMASSKGHYFDRVALNAVRNDPEVVEWLARMSELAFLPVKR